MGRHLLGMFGQPAFAYRPFAVLFGMPVLRHDVLKGQGDDLRLSWANDHRGDGGMVREALAIAELTGETVWAIVGESQNILEVCQKIIAYAVSSAPVLITGDVGTGKDVVARALAEVSKRQCLSFNCGAVAEGTLESDLFGQVKWAFTGAYADKQGLFEGRENAVISLDDIGDTSPMRRQHRRHASAYVYRKSSGRDQSLRHREWRLYIFLDESGDLGVELSKPGTSQHFVIALLLTATQKAVSDRIVSQCEAKPSKRHSRASGNPAQALSAAIELETSVRWHDVKC